jgi:NADPH2:quinone reductase
MRAAVVRDYGGSDAVRIEEDYPEPPIEPGTVRVQIAAAAVNFPDLLITANKYQVSAALPFVPGSEFAGTVIEIADDVSALAVGDRVFGESFIGGFAEEIVVEVAALAKIPQGVGMHEAAAFRVAHRTAFHALRGLVGLHAGEELIVLGAGGGVGLAAVQLGKVIGATVTAVASSTAKLDAAADMGATNLVNYTSAPLRQQLREILPEGANAVIDPVGGSLSEQALRALRWRGRFVSIGYASGEIPRIPLNLVLLKGIAVMGYQLREYAVNEGADMAEGDRELVELLATGKASPYIGASFPLSEVTNAMRRVEDGKAIGKVLLTR